MQPCDVYQTYADTTALEQELHYKPHISIQEGINRLYDWYASYSNLFNKKLTFN
jgi:UDP-glucuronate 4-epimerase